jgi:uncharacterized protein YkwD
MAIDVLLGLITFGLSVITFLYSKIKSKIIFYTIIIVPVLIFVGLLATRVRSLNTNRYINLSSSPPSPPALKANTKEIIELTNVKRLNAGLKPVKENSKLNEAALLRAEKIIEFDEWNHEATISGVPFTKALQQVNYWNITKGENLAKGIYTSSEVVDAWILSPGHKKNILNPEFQEIGIGIKMGKVGGENVPIIVQLFGGYIPPNYNQKDVESWQKTIDNLNSIIPSWESALGNSRLNQDDLKRLLDLLYQERTIAANVYSVMKSNKWLSKSEKDSITLYNSLVEQSRSLANKLNGK